MELPCLHPVELAHLITLSLSRLFDITQKPIISIVFSMYVYLILGTSPTTVEIATQLNTRVQHTNLDAMGYKTSCICRIKRNWIKTEHF